MIGSIFNRGTKVCYEETKAKRAYRSSDGKLKNIRGAIGPLIQIIIALSCRDLHSI